MHGHCCVFFPYFLSLKIQTHKHFSIYEMMKIWGDEFFFQLKHDRKKEAVAAFHLTVDDRETFFVCYNQPAIHTKHT